MNLNHCKAGMHQIWSPNTCLAWFITQYQNLSSAFSFWVHYHICTSHYIFINIVKCDNRKIEYPRLSLSFYLWEPRRYDVALDLVLQRTVLEVGVINLTIVCPKGDYTKAWRWPTGNCVHLNRKCCLAVPASYCHWGKPTVLADNSALNKTKQHKNFLVL